MPNLRRLFKHRFFLAGVDVIAVNLGFLLAFGLRFGPHLPDRAHNVAAYLHLVPAICIASVCVFYVSGLYTEWLHRTRTQVAYSIGIASCLLSGVVMAASYWSRWFALPRSVLLIALLTQVVILICIRLSIYGDQIRAGKRRVLIIAENEKAAGALALKLEREGCGRYQVDGFLGEDELQMLDSVLMHVDLVALTSGLAGKLDVAGHCAQRGKDVLLVPSTMELFYLGAKPDYVDDVLTLNFSAPSLARGDVLLKRAADIVVSTILLLFLGPIMLVTGIVIRVTSRGPALFQQERLGQRGRTFWLYKFRTMVVDAERNTGPILAAKDDPRITRLGKFLRSTRLDELPQLLNVLKGDMSMVGPRPEREFFVQQFEREIPTYSLRSVVKPGITGLAQVMGRYNSTVQRKLGLDLMYVHKYSFLLDLRILLQTIPVMLERDQADGVSTHADTRPIRRVKPRVAQEMSPLIS